MRIVVVDADKAFAQDVAKTLNMLGHQPEVFTSLAAARQHLTGVEEPLLIFLDHDFGQAGEEGQEGYDLCKWLRENHPFGLLLPIVYLTGREPSEHFLLREREEPYVHPSAYIGKEELARDAALLPRLLQRYQDQFERVCVLGEEQSARQALMHWGHLEAEPHDEP